MSSLNENTVKQIMLGYLKSFYKLRPRAERAPTVTGLDMRGSNEIIADGFLSFVQPDNVNFMATFEATSWETKKEVFFRERLSHILWDSFTMSLLAMVMVIAICHIDKLYLIPTYGFWQFLLTAVVFFLTCLLILRYSILFWPRYRYIFAIEQFKQYQANDQWVAYGYDVFSTKDRKYKRALVDQCRKYGFGLVEIDAQRKPNLIMAPSRAENFVPKQAFTRLLPMSEQWRQRVENAAKGPITKIKELFNKWMQPYQAHYFRWFPRTYYTQWAICAACLLALFFQMRIEYFKMPYKYVSEGIYQNRLEKSAKDNRPETEFFIVDAPEPGFLDSNFAPFIVPTNEEQFEDIVQTTGSRHADSLILPPVRIVSAYPGEATGLYYSCERFSLQNKAFYVLVDTIVPTMAAARYRLSLINDRGLSGTAVWPKCLGGPAEGFLILVDEIYLDEMQAITFRDSFQVQLDSLHHGLKVQQFLPESRFD